MFVDDLRLDGDKDFATAVADLRRNVDRLFDDAMSGSAVATAEAAAKRFTFQEEAAKAIETSDFRAIPVLGVLVRDRYLRQLDAIETVVIKQQDVLLNYLTRLVTPASASASAHAAGIATGSESPTAEMDPIVVNDPGANVREDHHNLSRMAASGWAHSGVIVGWLALVIAFVAIFLLAL